MTKFSPTLKVITLAFEMYRPTILSRISRPFTLSYNLVKSRPLKLFSSKTDGIDFLRKKRSYTSEAETKVDGDVTGLNM